MTEFLFPEMRFVQAGVPRPIVEKMRLEFTRSDATIRRAQSEFWATQSASGLRDYVLNARYSDDAIPEPESDVVVRSESTESALDVAESDASAEDSQSDSDDALDGPNDDSVDED